MDDGTGDDGTVTMTIWNSVTMLCSRAQVFFDDGTYIGCITMEQGTMEAARAFPKSTRLQ